MATGSLVFQNSAAKVLLLTHTDWIVCAYYPLFFEKNAKKKTTDQLSLSLSFMAVSFRRSKISEYL